MDNSLTGALPKGPVNSELSGKLFLFLGERDLFLGGRRKLLIKRN